MGRIWIYTGIALVLWILQSLYKAYTSPLRTVPGPLYTALTRLPLKLSIITGRRIYFIDALHKTHGPIVRISPDEVSISSTAEFKEIHRAGSPFLKSEWYSKFTMSSRPGVFDMRDPKVHAARRKLFARAFSKTELRREWEGVVREKVKLTVEKIRGEMLGSSDGRCDVLKWWTFLATDVSGHLMFGESFDMLSVGMKNEYIHILESTMKGSGINAELPLVGFIGRHLPIPSIKAMFRASDYLTEYGRRAVTNSRAASDSTRNIFSGMIYESEKGSETLTDLDVITEAGNLIVAGSDTTAVTLTYLVYAILSNPRLQREIEDEVLALAEDYDDATLEQLPLLNAAIKETLRLYGAAPGSLPRSVPEGGATFLGYYIPQGTTVSTQSYTIHRDANNFSDPEAFDASRWRPKDEGEGVSSQAQAAFSPFGAGARTCLGIHLAYMELRLAAAEFFRECKGVTLAPSVSWATMKPENYFLIAPRGHQCEVMQR
ncbi:cytochrome P450 [Aspergillus pseudoustus]|uniref:Cytochrome P450 n=1 Tax=Aspergillus pseudoustus TaxID=1810923 RepID=A0ABR4K7Q3_9EURO